MTHALFRRLRKARYRIKGLRVFAVGGVKEGANLKRYVQIQKSIEETQSMPDAIVSAALVLSESAKSAVSALLASAVQNCSDLKDQVDSATVGEGEVPVPSVVVDGMLAAADQIVNGVKALTGAPEIEVESEGPASAPGSGTPVTDALPQTPAIESAAPAMDEKVAAEVEKILMDALASMKSALPAEDMAKAALCKAKISPKMGYKQFLAIQNSHMVRLFDLMLELAPFIMDVASSPAVQEQMHEEHEASESPAVEAMEQATGVEDEGGPASVEMAKPKVEGEPMEKAIPAPVEVKPIAEQPIVKSADEQMEERFAKLLSKAMEPVVSLAAAIAQNKVSTEKAIADISSSVAKLQKSRAPSQSIALDPSARPGGVEYSGSRNLSAEVRAERAETAARKGR